MWTGVSPKRIATRSFGFDVSLAFPSLPSVAQPVCVRQAKPPLALLLNSLVAFGNFARGSCCFCSFDLECFAYKFDNFLIQFLSLITQQKDNLYFFFLRKEVIQPHLPIRLPCYDFTPVIRPALGGSFPLLNMTS